MTRPVVTLPPSMNLEAAIRFAREARARGAGLLEIRTDLHAGKPLVEISQEIDLLVSERGSPLEENWIAAARVVDRERPSHLDGALGAKELVSHHTARPMTTEEAVASWEPWERSHAFGIKHVEPLGDLRDAARLLRTQEQLIRRFGAGRVTVLGTGTYALPFRALLAEKNALDYVAFDSSWAAAPGQRLLDDALRAARRSGPRRAILGSDIRYSRSPRIHPPPFDRIELPDDAAIAELLSALHPFYEGFAVTNPFKQIAARAVGSGLPAVNTLARTATGYRAANTDVAGAREVLSALGSDEVHILGEGGVGAALREAAHETGVRLTFHRRETLIDAELSGALVWTWPPSVEAPPGLRLPGARVAIIAYGKAARAISRKIEALGGTPVRLGPRWLVAQARGQRAFWIGSEDR